MMNGFRRIAAPTQGRRDARDKSFPSPTRGWVTNENFAQNKPGGCRVLENWFPEWNGIRLRGGALKVATIGASRVTSMFRYVQGGTEKLFATSASAIYNISGLDPDTPPSADVSSQTDGDYSTLQMATSGGEFLYAMNEADAPQLYDGSSWTQITGVSSPAITGVTTSLLRHGWVYRNRIFMIERDSLNAWYLGTDSISGAASQIALAGVFERGGHLLFGATWSLDAGDGIDDKCVFVTDLGEVAVYEGADPSSSTTWNLVGRYDAAKPLGKNATMQAGGDLLIATIEGIVSLQEIMQKDPAALATTAVTRAIEPDWKFEARKLTDGYPWRMMKWSLRNMMIVSLPHSTLTSNPIAFVVNMETGSWAKYVGWDIQSMSLYGTEGYFGDASGSVYKMETTGKDGSASYTCKVCFAFDHLGVPGQHKEATMARARFLATVNFNPQLSVAVDDKPSFPAPPPSAADEAGTGLWDTAVWDTAVWDDGVTEVSDLNHVTTEWEGVVGHGITHAPQIQVTVGNTIAPNARLITYDLIYRPGRLVA